MQSHGDGATIEIAEPGYPTVRLLATHGLSLAAGVAVAVVAAGFAAAILGHGWVWCVAGMVGGAVLYLLLRSYVEMIQIIRETLLPP